MRSALLLALLALASCRPLPDSTWEPMPDPIPPEPGDQMPRVEPSEPGPAPTEPPTCAGACATRARLCPGADEPLEQCERACEARERLCHDSNAPALCWHPDCMVAQTTCAELARCRGTH